VTGSVQYLDVGLTLDVQPTVYLDSDVAVKISLEVSSILKQVTTASGTIAYEIGTRNASTLLRLKDGETQILAGLIQDTDTRTANSIPLLGQIPILSHLFGTNHADREKDEIVLSITPRIIRMQPRPASDATEFWYGSESRTRSRPYTNSERGADNHPAQAPTSGPPPGAYPGPPAAPAPNSGVEPVNPSVAPGAVSAPLSAPEARRQSAPAPAPQGLPVTALPAPIVAAAATGAAAQQTQASAAAAGVASALSVEGPAEAKVGEEFDVRVQLSSEEPITHLRSQLRYDSSALQIVSASAGDVVPAGAGGPTVNTRGIGAQLDITTPAEDPVQGSGTLMTVRFKAVASRPSTNVAAMLNVLGGTGAAVGSSSAPPLAIVIHP
jgi:general secretion pathway protein D